MLRHATITIASREIEVLVFKQREQLFLAIQWGLFGKKEIGCIVSRDNTIGTHVFPLVFPLFLPLFLLLFPFSFLVSHFSLSLLANRTAMLYSGFLCSSTFLSSPLFYRALSFFL